MADGITYSIQFTGVSVSAAQDLFAIKASSAVPIEILWARLSCESQTSPATLRLNCKRISGTTVTLGSGGTTPTAVEVGQVSGRAAVSTVGVNLTTRSSGTSTSVIHPEAMQVLNGWDLPLIPELFYQIDAGTLFLIGLEVAPSSAIVMNGVLYFTEIA